LIDRRISLATLSHGFLKIRERTAKGAKNAKKKIRILASFAFFALKNDKHRFTMDFEKAMYTRPSYF